MTPCMTLPFTSYAESVPAILDQSGAQLLVKGCDAILLKPNLVTSDPFPITTHPDCVRAVITWLKSVTNADIVIGEGCGDMAKETDDIYAALGYTALSRETGVPLIDLNTAPLTRRENPSCEVFPEIYLPEVAFTHTLISLPVLKAHSLADITGSLKNMIGLAPPDHYSGQFGIWKKALFHNRMHQSIMDLNSYITPAFTLMDASVGMAEYHLGGPTCDPPVNTLIAGHDPKAVDRKAAALLGFDWHTIPHLR